MALHARGARGGSGVRRLLGLLLLLLASCGPATERTVRLRREAGASGGRLHRFRVEVKSAPTEISHDLTLKEIGRLSGAAGSGLKTQGLSTIRHSMATRTRFSTAKGSNEVYAWFDEVILVVAISSIVIHIPKEYAPGSCEYQIVLEHERGHDRAARETAVKFAGKLERALGAAVGMPTRFDPVISTDFDSAAGKLKEAIASIVDPVYDEYELDEKETQKRLDRPDPYDAVYKTCDGWK